MRRRLVGKPMPGEEYWCLLAMGPILLPFLLGFERRLQPTVQTVGMGCGLPPLHDSCLTIGATTRLFSPPNNGSGRSLER